jgi:hypothetical protein
MEEVMANIDRQAAIAVGFTVAAAISPLASSLPGSAKVHEPNGLLVAVKAIDRATLALVAATAAKGYANPEAATVTNVRRSLATSGTGYCGEITLEGRDETTIFHVILATPRGPSVLRLSDYPEPESDPQAATVHTLMLHFGCLEEPMPPSI